jgi:hypothetical protein
MKQENSNPEISPQEAKKEGVGNFVINSLTNPSPVRIFIIALILLNYKFWIILFSGGLSVYEKFEFISLYYLNCESFDIKELKNSYHCWDGKGFGIFIVHLLVKITIAFLISIAQPFVLYVIKLLSTKVAKKVSDAEYMTQYNAIEKMVKQYEAKVSRYSEVKTKYENLKVPDTNDKNHERLSLEKTKLYNERRKLAAELFIPENATEENKNNIFERIKSIFQLPDLKTKVEQIINLKSSVIEDATAFARNGILNAKLLNEYISFFSFVNNQSMEVFLNTISHFRLYNFNNGQSIFMKTINWGGVEMCLDKSKRILFVHSGFHNLNELKSNLIVRSSYKELNQLSQYFWNTEGNGTGKIWDILNFKKEDIKKYFKTEIEFFGDEIIKGFPSLPYERIKERLLNEKTNWFYLTVEFASAEKSEFTLAGECVLEYIQEKLKRKEV